MPRKELIRWEAPLPAENSIARRRPIILRPEIRQQCIIYFEEELYALALQLLSSTLIAGTAIVNSNSQSSIYIPPPYILALLGTLVVHPSLTTRTTSLEKKNAADGSLNLLKHINKLVGAKNANFGDAFKFATQNGSSSRKPPARRRAVQTGAHDGESDESGEERVNMGLAEDKAIWTRAVDFWAVLGWAFNSSVNCELRWRRWELWVTFMLDALEDDLFERVREAREKLSKKSGQVPDPLLSASIIAQYLESSGAKDRSSRRRIMRAVFANGNDKAMVEFQEIWPNETKRPKPSGSTTLNRENKIDIEADDYRDYLQSSEAEDSDKIIGVEGEEANGDISSKLRTISRTSKTPRKQHCRSSPETSEEESDSQPDDSSSYGAEDALNLRRRCLVLLTHAATHLSHSQFTPLFDLLATYSEFLRPLPLRTFAFFTSPSSAAHAFPPSVLLLLNQLSLQEFLETAAPRYEANQALTQEQLRVWYLPWTANTANVERNAKVSLLVESLARLVHASIGLVSDGGKLRAAVEEGIQARTLKIRPPVVGKASRGQRGSLKTNDEAESVLHQSAGRLQMLLDIAGV